MRRHLGWALASVILVALSGLGGAMAADMAVKARPVAPPVVIYNWSGCYIGGNVGGGWNETRLAAQPPSSVRLLRLRIWVPTTAAALSVAPKSVATINSLAIGWPASKACSTSATLIA